MPKGVGIKKGKQAAKKAVAKRPAPVPPCTQEDGERVGQMAILAHLDALE